LYLRVVPACPLGHDERSEENFDTPYNNSPDPQQMIASLLAGFESFRLRVKR